MVEQIGSGGRRVVKTVDDTEDAVAKELGSEVDEQAEPLVGEPAVGEQLLAVNRLVALGGPEFDDDQALDDQIGAVADIEGDAA